MKVLVVEDDALIGMELVMLIEEWGHSPDGPYRTPEAALEAIQRGQPEAAILDVNLGDGKTSLPVAELLRTSDTPFVFLTGYAPSRYTSNDTFATAMHLRKPVSEHELRSLLARLSGPPDGQ